MTVADLIASRQEVYTIADDMTVHDAARYLREKRLRSVGVEDPQGRLAGVVSQSDIANKVAAENKCPAWMRVSEIMSTDLISVPPETGLHECLSLMEKRRIFHLLVVDGLGKYRGMISVRDLLKVIASDQQSRADLLEAFIFPPR